MGFRESCRHPSKFRRDSFGERNEGTVAALADLSIRLKDPKDTCMGIIEEIKESPLILDPDWCNPKQKVGLYKRNTPKQIEHSLLLNFDKDR